MGRRAPCVPRETMVSVIFRRLGEICSLCCNPSEKALEIEAPVQKPFKNWYRVHPVNETTFTVRADCPMGDSDDPIKGRVDRTRDAGLAFLEKRQIEKGGLIPRPPIKEKVVKSQDLRKRTLSVPPSSERKLGMTESVGFDTDAFTNTCRICFDKPGDIVVLPCRHGGMCEDCLRRSLFSRPQHRGGRQCPYCRRMMTDIVRIGEHSDTKGPYGYSIQLGAFGDLLDDGPYQASPQPLPKATVRAPKPLPKAASADGLFSLPPLANIEIGDQAPQPDPRGRVFSDP